MIKSKSACKNIKRRVKFFIFSFSSVSYLKKKNEIQVHVHGCQLLIAIFVFHIQATERKKKNTRVLPLFNIYFNNTMNLIDFVIAIKYFLRLCDIIGCLMTNEVKQSLWTIKWGEYFENDVGLD